MAKHGEGPAVGVSGLIDTNGRTNKPTDQPTNELYLITSALKTPAQLKICLWITMERQRYIFIKGVNLLPFRRHKTLLSEPQILVTLSRDKTLSSRHNEPARSVAQIFHLRAAHCRRIRYTILLKKNYDIPPKYKSFILINYDVDLSQPILNTTFYLSSHNPILPYFEYYNRNSYLKTLQDSSWDIWNRNTLRVYKFPHFKALFGSLGWAVDAYRARNPRSANREE